MKCELKKEEEQQEKDNLYSGEYLVYLCHQIMIAKSKWGRKSPFFVKKMGYLMAI